MNARERLKDEAAKAAKKHGGWFGRRLARRWGARLRRKGRMPRFARWLENR